jgi:hypothetical protein
VREGSANRRRMLKTFSFVLVAPEGKRVIRMGTPLSTICYTRIAR